MSYVNVYGGEKYEATHKILSRMPFCPLGYLYVASPFNGMHRPLLYLLKSFSKLMYQIPSIIAQFNEEIISENDAPVCYPKPRFPWERVT